MAEKDKKQSPTVRVRAALLDFTDFQLVFFITRIVRNTENVWYFLYLYFTKLIEVLVVLLSSSNATQRKTQSKFGFRERKALHDKSFINYFDVYYRCTCSLVNLH